MCVCLIHHHQFRFPLLSEAEVADDRFQSSISSYSRWYFIPVHSYMSSVHLRFCQPSFIFPGIKPRCTDLCIKSSLFLCEFKERQFMSFTHSRKPSFSIRRSGHLFICPFILSRVIFVLFLCRIDDT